MSLTYQELIDTIESNPSGVREALELVKRQLSAYPDATSADDSDTIALSKDDGSGTVEALSVATLLLRAVENNGGAVSFESGTLTNLPAAGTDGAWYFATDEGVLYRDDGATWNAILGNTSLIEQATDTGTDVYASAVNTSPPADGYTVRRDFQVANNTTTPMLDSLTITTRGGSALWANALSGVHTLQLSSGGGSWRVLDPNPVSANSANAPVSRDSNGRAKFADPSADQDVVTKAYVDPRIASSWVNFDGTDTVVIRDHYNVSSITDNGTGDYVVNLTNSLADTNYAILESAASPGSRLRADSVQEADVNIGSFRFLASDDAGTATDSQISSAAIFGGN